MWQRTRASAPRAQSAALAAWATAAWRRPPQRWPQPRGPPGTAGTVPRSGPAGEGLWHRSKSLFRVAGWMKWRPFTWHRQAGAAWLDGAGKAWVESRAKVRAGQGWAWIQVLQVLSRATALSACWTFRTCMSETGGFGIARQAGKRWNCLLQELDSNVSIF